ncbi:TSUP family transporter [Tolypothrix campylonemoides VB511288]|nr:TSUP family transporter [Tolypothrix campylonemoides VB511288]
MSFMQACFLFFAAWMSGVLNSVAGGGGLIIFPALIVTGLPAISANATSTLASCPGYIASISAYRNELWAQQQLSWLFGSIPFWLVTESRHSKKSSYRQQSNNSSHPNYE